MNTNSITNLPYGYGCEHYQGYPYAGMPDNRHRRYYAGEHGYWYPNTLQPMPNYHYWYGGNTMPATCPSCGKCMFCNVMESDSKRQYATETPRKIE